MVDKINKRYGKDSVTFGEVMSVEAGLSLTDIDFTKKTVMTPNDKSKAFTISAQEFLRESTINSVRILY